MKEESVDLKTILEDHYLFHSTFQHDYLITAKAGNTEYGMYKQSLRELYSRIGSLRDALTRRDLARVDIKELQHNLEVKEYDNPFDAERDTIQLREKIMADEENGRVVDEILREAKRFYEQAVFLKKKLGKLDEGKRNRLEKDMWLHHVLKMASIEYETRGRIGVHGYEHFLALPADLRKAARPLYANPAELREYLEDKSSKILEEISEAPSLTTGVEQKLLDSAFK